MKRVLSTVLIALILVSSLPMVPISVNAKNISGDYSYYLNGSNATITEYLGNGGDIVIPSTLDGYTVTKIGSNAFNTDRSYNITSVTISDEIERIGMNAFKNCYNLSKVKIGSLDSWLKISFDNEFSNPLYYAKNLYIGDELLRDMVTPAEVTRINKYSFYNCESLESIVFSEGLKAIYGYAFYGCKNLDIISICESLYDVRGNAFETLGAIQEVHVKDISMWCRISFENEYSNPLFYGRELYVNDELITSLVIPKGVSSIGKYAFADLNNVEEIFIPEGVHTIKEYAFWRCTGIEKVVLPSSVKAVQKNALVFTNVFYFGSEDDWKNIDIYRYDEFTDSSYDFYYSEKKCNISFDPETGMLYEITSDSEIIVHGIFAPESVVKVPEQIGGMPVVGIGEKTFALDSNIESVYLPGGIRQIAKRAFKDYGYNNNPSIKTVYFDGSPYQLYDALGYSNGGIFYDYEIVCNMIPMEGLILKGGVDSITIDCGESFVAEFEYYPENSNAQIILSSESDCISIEKHSIYGKAAGEAIVTAVSENGVTYKFTVKVIGPTGISVINPPSKTYYGLREALNIEGLKIIKEYNDGTSVELTDYTLSSFNPLQRGLQTITVTGDGFKTSFDVFVSGAALGDINLDESVTSIDSNLMRRVIAGEMAVSEYTDEYFACDVNGDGEINAMDSSILRRMIAG